MKEKMDKTERFFKTFIDAEADRILSGLKISISKGLIATTTTTGATTTGETTTAATTTAETTTAATTTAAATATADAV